MGEVYLVQHPRLPRHEALKILRPDISSDPSFRERFIREADLAAGLRHPHVVGIHDRGDHEGRLWIAMDYVDGTDLAHQVAQRYPSGMPTDLVLTIITAVASALDYAHKKGLLHRDVKPANIIVADLDSDDPSVLLADFGIARPMDDISGITTTNMTVGTLAYAAPEQLMGETIDGRADQYALAATTYNLLTGSQLFPHTNPAVVISRQLNTTPPRVGEHRPDLAALDSALLTSLSKDPAKRHRSCTAFAQALASASQEAPAASPTATTQAGHLPGKALNTNTSPRIWLPVAMAVAVLLTVGTVVSIWEPWASPNSTTTETTSAATRPTSITSAPGTPSSSVAVVPPVLPSSETKTSADETPPIATTPPSSSTAATPSDEQAFIRSVRTLPMYVLPNGRYSTDADLVASGYRACAAFDQFPDDSERATKVIYPTGTATMDADMFMLYSANYLCPQHAHLYANY